MLKNFLVFQPDEVDGAWASPEVDFDPGILSMRVENAARAYRVENFSTAAQVLRATVAEVDKIPVNMKYVNTCCSKIRLFMISWTRR